MNQIFRVALALFIALPMGLSAQSGVNRETYPDYSDSVNPDMTMLGHAGMQKSAARNDGARGQRPAYVNNAEQKFFPPVFNQDGGSCGSASRICYMFTYELNAYRDLDGKDPQNYYPSHFVWLLTNGNSGKNEFVTSIGVPSAATYGGQTYSSLFGSQDCAHNNFGWMQGYDKWFEAMHNRMLDPVNFPLNVGTEEGRELVKNWLWNHNGDTSFKAGGICGIGVASSGGNYEGKIPSTTANSAAGVTGKKYVKAWGTQVDHALTIVGYDDRIEFDLDGNGVAGEADKDEVGAWIIVNSWGAWWGNNGFIYCPYAYAGPAFNSDGTFPGNWWQPEIYKVRKDYRPLRTIKLEMDYTRRSEIKLSAGISSNVNANSPEKIIEFEHFKYAGDGNYGNTNPAPEVPMLGRWADGKLHSEPMEFGYDLTDLTEGYDRSMPLKYFFIIDTKSWAKGSGNIYKASVMDYEFDLDGIETPFDMPYGSVEIKSAGTRTVITAVVHGEPYYSPMNISLNGTLLNWGAPLPSTAEIEGYKIYHEERMIAEVGKDNLMYNIPADEKIEGTFSVSAVYDGGHESKRSEVKAPVAFESTNMAIDLKKSGLKLPDVFKTKYENATIEFYIKPNSLAYWNQSAGPGWGTFMMHAEGDGRFTAGWATTGNDRFTTSSAVLKNGVWSHIAIVVSGNTMTAYVNGEIKGSCTSSTYSGIGGFGDLVFSADINSYNSYTDAQLDEIRIWNRARTANEIRNSYNTQFGGNVMPKGLVAYYKGNLIDVNGKEMLQEHIGGKHGEILNSSYEQVESSKEFGTTSGTELTVKIKDVSGDIHAGTPVKLNVTYSDAVSGIRWDIPAAGVEDLAVTEPTVIFNVPGEHTITVTATDISGNTVTDSKTVIVLPVKEIDATFRASKNRAIVGEKIAFIVENPSFGQMYEWTIPGAEEEKVKGLHGYAVFKSPGKQKVTLEIKSLDGTRSASSSIDIEVLESAPQAAFEISPAVILKGEKTYLTDVSNYNPTRWKWTVENKSKKYVINGQNSSLTPSASGVYDVTLEVSNEVGSNSYTRERALIVCNDDSKNGLNFSGRENAKVTATTYGFSGQRSALTVEWWMCPEKLEDDCLGIGEDFSTFLLTTKADGTMWLSANGYSGKSNAGFVIANEWHHYTAILDGGFADFYRDGEYISTSYISYNAFIPSLDSFSIGNDKAKMNGQIDELRVWNSVVNGEKLLSVCNTHIDNPAMYSDLVLYYDFNQSGGDVTDRALYGNTGVRSGFGPDGDAWGLSRGVFCLNTSSVDVTGDITDKYLKNCRASFQYESKTVNNSVSNRFYALKDWTIENAPVSGSVTTGAHVDKQKDNCMTFTAIWDGFGTLKDHKVYQTITLPFGNYKFTANYHDKWEGQCGNSYVVAAEGKGLPDTAQTEESIAYIQMAEKGSTTSNSIEFKLEEETEVSLGLLVNMSNKECMTIQSFTLERDNVEYLEADGGLTSVGCITELERPAAEEGIYDLQGRRVTEPVRGSIYIVNGKKMIFR